MAISKDIKKARALCIAKGEKLTPLRQRVFEIVLAHRAPIKAYDILRELQRDNEKAAPPTAYRALDFLVDMGILHRLESLSAYVACSHKDMSGGGLFFVCDNCHAIVEEHDTRIDRMLAKKGAETGFTVSNHEVEIHGTCRKCS